MPTMNTHTLDYILRGYRTTKSTVFFTILRITLITIAVIDSS